MALLTGCTSLPRETAPPAAAPPTSAAAGNTTIVAIAPSPAPKANLLDFLGVNQVGKQLFNGIGGLTRRIQSRLGNRFPGLEPKPPLRLLDDPANLSEDAPPDVSAAAEIKAEEDAAEQKIKGLRYLATIGCGGCYPDVEKALLAALDDCTEAVRYEAVRAIRGTSGQACTFCKSGSCCSAAVQKKLRSVAFELDSCLCYVEPSERVRRHARLALQACGPPCEKQDALPTEGQTGNPPDAVAAAAGMPAGQPNLLDPATDAANLRIPGFVTTASGTQPLQPAAADGVTLSSQLATPDLRPTATGIGSAGHVATETPPAVVSWERISVVPEAFASTEEARAALEQILAKLNGTRTAPLPAFSAAQVSVIRVGWTKPAAARSAAERELVAHAPVGSLCPVICDEYGWQVIRILGRQQAP